MKSKTILAIIISMIFVISLVACSAPSTSTDSFTQYNILSFEVDSNSRDSNTFGDITSYREYWIITNNSDSIISEISFTVCFYDADRNIIDRDSRFIDVSVRPGQSLKQLVCTESLYVSSEVTNYEYALENGRTVELDIVAQSVD